MTKTSPSATLSINGERLWSRLMEMAKIGATAKGGVCRLALTDLDKQGRDLFCDWATEAGCTIHVDAMGNIFARRPGADSDALPIASGSHLDTQPTGGKFDGVLGVLAALEVIESLNDHEITTKAPVEAVVWTNEEGARFTPAMIGSGVYCGEFDLDYAYAREDDEQTTLGSALAAIGYKGSTACGAHKLGAHIELHIEQGPILEAEDTEIGVLTGVQGIRWYELAVDGAETHAGPSPMKMRKDPVPVLASLLPEIYAIAERAGEDARCTVGVLNASPGSTNTVPGRVTASVDLRHPDAAILGSMDAELRDLVASSSTERCPVSLAEIWHSPPVTFDESCIQSISKAAASIYPEFRMMVSGAGHDSVYVSRVAPTGMIFIPCKDGISHNEIEDTKPDQATLGTTVLLNAILDLAKVA